jgi:uridine phosphorylase
VEQQYPILEFDPSPDALINPNTAARPLHGTTCAVLCFFQDVISRLVQERQIEVVAHFQSEIGRHPVYRLTHEDRRLLVVQPGVGAPLAAGLLEDVIGLGCTCITACGGAGALDATLAAGHIVVPIAAVRDEGTSYHYLPPSREVEADRAGLAAAETVLRRHGLQYVAGKTWTTDAFYRETRARIDRRRGEGCIVVEMEAAAFFAVARFRRVSFAQLLYAGDDVSGSEWNARGWTTHDVRDTLFWLAAETCLELSASAAPSGETFPDPEME